jgi:hypothetical protein
MEWAARLFLALVTAALITAAVYVTAGSDYLSLLP